MIQDSLLLFSSAQDLSQVVGTYASTNVIDFGLGTTAAPGIPSLANGGGARDMGVGDKPAIKVCVSVNEAFASAGAATLQVHFQGAPDNGAGAPDTFVTWYSTMLYALADLAQGARLMDIDMPRPPSGEPMPRFVRLLYQVATATTTAGTCDASLVLDRIDQPIGSSGHLSGYRAGINVAN